VVEPTNDETDRLLDDRVRALPRGAGRKRGQSSGFGGGAIADGATVRELLPISGERVGRADGRGEEIAADLADELSHLRTVNAELELKVREQIEVEHVRDLEIVRLEHELDETKGERTRLADELFHATRRADDLDRRWNALAATYEECAAHLVDAGAQLESIHAQMSYRVVLAISRSVRRWPAVYAMAKRLAGGRAGREIR
jgi:hypothetical protein